MHQKTPGSGERLRRAGAFALAGALLAGGSVVAAGAAAQAATNDNVGTGDLTVVHQQNQGWKKIRNNSSPARDGFAQGPPMYDTKQDGSGDPIDLGTPQSFWDGDQWDTPVGNVWGWSGVSHATDFSPQILGKVSPIPGDLCGAETVKLDASARLTNLGPANGVWTIGASALVSGRDTSDETKLAEQNFGASNTEYPVGRALPLVLSGTVPIADLQAGKIDLGIAIELNHNGAKGWKMHDFALRYDLNCAPKAEKVAQIVLPGAPTDISLTDAVSTDDSSPDWTTLQLIDPETGNPSPTGTVTIPGEGTYTVGIGGQVKFTPAPGFGEGDTSSIEYTVKDARGVSVTSRASIELAAAKRPVPPALVRPASPSTPATFDPVAGTTSPDAGVTIDASSVQLIDPATDAPSASGVVTIAGEGTYTLDPVTGSVVFVPEDGFVGESTIGYTVADSRGLRAPGTLTAKTSGKPGTTPVTETVVPGKATSIDLIDDFVKSGGIDPDWSTLRLLDPQGQPVTELVTEAGTYTIDPANPGTVIFRSAPGFPGGPAPAVKYSVADLRGEFTEGTVSVIVARAPIVDETSPKVKGTTHTTRSITLDPAGSVVARDGGTIDKRSVKLVGEGGALVDTLTIPGKGTFVVDSATGLVTFTAVAGFVGTVDATFSVADDRGLRTTGTLTVDVAPAAASGGRVVDVLARTGAGTGAAALAGGAALLIAGAGALVLSRRRAM